MNNDHRGSWVTDTRDNCGTGVLLVHYNSGDNADCTILVVERQAADCMSRL